mmetsp:Transcript_868/g.2973  ORF Transcript_868/g.2973 Transcript_868/m.2973 type:complete len:1271 (-) Transcript_868:82-3894(-)
MGLFSKFARRKKGKKGEEKSTTITVIPKQKQADDSDASTRTPVAEPSQIAAISVTSPIEANSATSTPAAASQDTTSAASAQHSASVPLNSDQSPVQLVTSEEHQVIRVVRESLPSPAQSPASPERASIEINRSGAASTTQSPEPTRAQTAADQEQDDDDDSLCLSDSKLEEQSSDYAPPRQYLDAGATSKTKSVLSDLSGAHQKTSSEDELENGDAASLNLSYENDDEIRQLMDLTDLEDDIRREAPLGVKSPSPAEDKPQRAPQPQQLQKPAARQSTNPKMPIHDMKTPRARAQIPTPTPHNDKSESKNQNEPSDDEWDNITQKKLQHQRELEEIEAQLLEAQQEHEIMEQQLRNSLEHSEDGSSTHDGTELDGTRDLSQVIGADMQQEIFNSMAEEIDHLKFQQNAQNAALQEYKNMVDDQRKALEMWSEYQKEMFNQQKEKMVESLKSELKVQDQLLISVSGATPSSPGDKSTGNRPVPRLSIPRNISNGVEGGSSATTSVSKSPRRRSSSVHKPPHRTGGHSRTTSISSTHSLSSTASSSSRYSHSQSRNVSPKSRAGRLSARKSPRRPSPRTAAHRVSPSKPNGTTLQVAKTPDRHTTGKKSKSRNSSPEQKKSRVSPSKHNRSRSDHEAGLFWTKGDNELSKTNTSRVPVPKISFHEASSQNLDVSATETPIPQTNGSTSARSGGKNSARKQAEPTAQKKSEPTNPPSASQKKTAKRRSRKRKSKKGKNPQHQDATSVPPEDERWRFFVNSKEQEKKKFNNRFERLYNVGVEKKRLLESWAEKERKKQLEKEVLEIRQTPAISDTSRKIAEKKTKDHKSNGAKILRESGAWDRLYEISKQPASPKRLKDINVYEQSKLVECTFEPELSRGTNQIAWKKIQRGERELPAYEALFREAKVKNDVLNHIIQEKARVDFDRLPKSRRSTLSKAERKDLFERLVNSNAERDKELDAIREHMDQETQRASSAGRSRSRSGTRKRDIGGNIGEYLYKEGVAHLESKKQRERDFEKELERTRSKGFVGKMSSAALEKLRERSLRILFDKLKGKAERLLVSEIHTAKRKHLAQSDALKNIVPTLEQQAPNRQLDFDQFRQILQDHCDLYQISVEVKYQRRQEELLREANQEVVFKPSLNPKSVELDKRRRSSQTDRYLQLLQLGAEKEERLNEKRKSLAQKELDDCTFSPQIESAYEPRRPRTSLFERSFSTPRSIANGHFDGELDLRQINGELDFDEDVAYISEDDYEEVIMVDEDEQQAARREHPRIERLA